MTDLLKKLLAIAGLVFGLFALLSAAGAGFSAPSWVLPLGACCTAGAVVLLVFA